ncbi:MAG: hypothetical protein H6916_05565 [Novosphingobium sp.]|nr:hypothetical protein [Novosphingobium sp.]
MAGQSARILMVFVAQALAFLPGIAHASSRFDLGDASPLRAKAHLDFTIIIPGIIQLANRSESDQGMTRNGISPFANSATEMVAIGGGTRSSLVAFGNSGTLAFQRSPAGHQIGQQHESVAFVVSMP